MNIHTHKVNYRRNELGRVEVCGHHRRIINFLKAINNTVCWEMRLSDRR